MDTPTTNTIGPGDTVRVTISDQTAIVVRPANWISDLWVVRHEGSGCERTYSAGQLERIAEPRRRLIAHVIYDYLGGDWDEVLATSTIVDEAISAFQTGQEKNRPPLAVTPADLDRQRRLGWPDFHPEMFCHRCGGRNVWSWWVDSDRFNIAMGRDGDHQWGGIICPGCFVALHEEATGLRCTWKLEPDPTTPFRHIDDDDKVKP